MDTNNLKLKLREELTKTEVKDEIKTYIKSDAFRKIIADIIEKELKTNKKFDDKIVDVSANVLTQLYKVLWIKRNFWQSALSNKTA